MKELNIDCHWIPPSHGGRRFDPDPGLRLGIRWQRYVLEDQDIYRDVEIQQLSMDPETRQGISVVRLTSKVPKDWLLRGELIEFLEGFKVVAVGRISDENPKQMSSG